MLFVITNGNMLKRGGLSLQLALCGRHCARNRRFGEDYMDFYASGEEGMLDTEVVMDFAKLGWIATVEAPELSKETRRSQ